MRSPEPLKVQLHRAVVEQLVEQGLGDPVLATPRTTPPSALEACNCRMLEQVDPGKPLIPPSSMGLISKVCKRSPGLMVKEAVAKKSGCWPPWESSQDASYQAPCIVRCSLANWGLPKGGKQGSGAAPHSWVPRGGPTGRPRSLPKPKTRNPKTQTLNPKPQNPKTLNP